MNKLILIFSLLFWLDLSSQNVTIGTIGIKLYSGTVNPNGNIIANAGDEYFQRASGNVGTMWKKKTGMATTTGWVELADVTQVGGTGPTGATGPTGVSGNMGPSGPTGATGVIQSQLVYVRLDSFTNNQILHTLGVPAENYYTEMKVGVTWLPSGLRYYIDYSNSPNSKLVFRNEENFIDSIRAYLRPLYN
jgi:hypothetical protein